LKLNSIKYTLNLIFSDMYARLLRPLFCKSYPIKCVPVSCGPVLNISYSRLPNNFLEFVKNKCESHNYVNPDLDLKFDSLVKRLSDHEDLSLMISDKFTDKELVEAAEIELLDVESDLDSLVEEISDLVVPPEKYDGENAVLEVVAGAGGLEAAVFADELLQLYLGYAQYLGYQTQLTECVSQNVLHGTRAINKAVVHVEGEGVFSSLKYETGVHRVQRVPVTGSKNDRLHTSTCSLCVLPAPRNIKVKLGIKDSSLKWEFMRARGAGGQGVNTTDSAVRLTHLPSGTVVESQEERSQERNKSTALRKLEEILYTKQFDQEQAEVLRSRKGQVGNMDRNEKIRTYNFNRHSISDHRITQSRTVPNIATWFNGQYGYDLLDEFKSHLREQEKKSKLLDYLEDFKA